MKCEIKRIKPDEKKDCTDKTVGMFKTSVGNLPFCDKHQLWAKANRLILRQKDNYFG